MGPWSPTPQTTSIRRHRMSASKWYKRHPQRLQAEGIIMRQRFGQFVLKKDRLGHLFWEGILITNFSTPYQVKITYPQNYPYQRPVFHVIRPKIRKDSPHIFENGSLCVYPKRWDYKKCTAPAGVTLVVSWLALYEIWLRTGKRW